MTKPNICVIIGSKYKQSITNFKGDVKNDYIYNRACAFACRRYRLRKGKVESKMRRRILSALLCICISISLITVTAKDNEDIVILYESDVHCAIDGYAKVSAVKSETKEDTDYVSLVSSGDFIQGSSLGALSEGGYIIDIMNKVGYDAVTLGNHEFDYKIPRLKELADELSAAVVSCNFVNSVGEPIYEPYKIISYGDTDIAYLGITTPESLTKSTPAYFQDENGEYIYDFCGDTLYDTVQKSTDDARRDGADYVVALSHLGSEGVTERWSAQEVIANTSGIDIILDGHSHSTIESAVLKNKEGEDVIMSSTGTKLENLGKLTINSDGSVETELIPLAEYPKTDSETAEYIAQIEAEYESKTSAVIGKSEVNLTVLYENGERAVRNSETNLGDLCADAYREVLGADVGFMNGGGIRADIQSGDITYNDILSVYPWNNQACTAKVTGQQILDALEFGVSLMPEESGGFQQVSGITFDVDLSVPSHVIRDKNEMFLGIDGERRIKNVKVLNRETNEYEALNPEKHYVLASHSYLLKDGGDGFTMFKGAEILKDSVMLDNELLTQYIKNDLGGTVGQEYAREQGRINVINVPLRKTFEAMGMTVDWFDPDTVIVSSAGQSAVFKIGSNIITCGEDSYETEESAALINDTTYISFDAIAILGLIMGSASK